ncbi:MAG: hypothetical protein C4522_10940 [Desulfobacteraceae bacterium]|nr:MAG: hypothetical protein C4522_10940 [Desulfobacteraceae bacterium]
MVQAFPTIAHFHQSCFYGRPRDKKVQGFFGLKIADVELITLFNYVNPSRVNQNNAVRQVLIE